MNDWTNLCQLRINPDLLTKAVKESRLAMRFITAYAEFNDPNAVDNARRATVKIAAEFTGTTPVLIVFFSAMNYDPDVLAQSMRDAFPDAVTFGCTASGESVNDRMLRHSVVAMAFSDEVFDHCRMALVLKEGAVDGDQGIFDSVDGAMRHISRDAGESLLDLDYREYVGFMLADAVNEFTESAVERIGELTDVTYIGGVAGDDYKFSDEPRVFYRGKAYKNACVVGLWKPRSGFGLLKTQAADLLDKTFTATRVEGNIIWEFDGRSAAEVYAEAIGIPPSWMHDLGIDDFAAHPLALQVDGEPFLRPVLHFVGGKGVWMAATAKEGQRFSLTRTSNLTSTTLRALEAKKSEMGAVAAILHVNCALRSMILEREKETAEFGMIFKGIPSVAFSSYSEIYIGVVEITSTMILFK